MLCPRVEILEGEPALHGAGQMIWLFPLSYLLHTCLLSVPHLFFPFMNNIYEALC